MNTDLCTRIKDKIKEHLYEDLRVAEESFEKSKQDIKEVETERSEEGFDIAKTEVIWFTESQKTRVKELKEKATLVEEKSVVVQIGDIVTVDFLKHDDSCSEPKVLKTITVKLTEDQQDITDEYTPLNPTELLAVEILGKRTCDIVEFSKKNNYPSNMALVNHIEKGSVPKDIVALNTVVGVYDEEFEEMEWYFLTHLEGGYEITEDIDGEMLDIYILNSKAPLSTFLIGKKIGQEVIFTNGNIRRNLTIKHLYM